MMTAEELKEWYDIDSSGRITTPGKFEGEQLYVPYFWEIFLDGFASRDNGTIIGFDVDEEDKRLFPQLKGRRTVKLMERGDGFVVEVQ